LIIWSMRLKTFSEVDGNLLGGSEI